MSLAIAIKTLILNTIQGSRARLSLKKGSGNS